MDPILLYLNLHDFFFCVKKKYTLLIIKLQRLPDLNHENIPPLPSTLKVNVLKMLTLRLPHSCGGSLKQLSCTSVVL